MSSDGLVSTRSFTLRLYLLLGLLAAGLILTYFTLPQRFVERNRSERQLDAEYEALQESLNELSRLTMIAHVDAVRAASPAPAQPKDLVAELALNHATTLRGLLRKIDILSRRPALPETDLLLGRLDAAVETFIGDRASAVAMEQVLLRGEQMARLSARALELRHERREASDALLGPWTAVLSLALQAGILFTIGRLIRSSRSTVAALTDAIRDRDQQTAQLRESEERLRLSLRSAGQGLYDLDLTTGDAVVSPEYATMLGYDPATFRETNALWASRLHPDDRQKVYSTFEAYVRGDLASYEVECRQKTREGGWLWILSIGSIATRDAAGRPLRMLGTHTNIDARKRAEEALNASEVRMRQILDGLFGFVGVCTLDGILIEANDAPLQAAGLRREDVLGRPFWATYWWNYDASVQAELQAALARAGRGEIVRYEPVVRIQGGALITIDVTFSPMRDAAGEITQILGFGVDITQRKQAAAALATSEARLRATIEAAPVPMALNDGAHRITYLNRTFIQTYGYDLQDIPTLADWWPKAYPDPAYRQSVADAWHAELTRASMTGTPFTPVEVKIRCKDGSERFVLATASQLLGAFSDTNVVVLFDITDRKQVEAALRVSENRLRTILKSEPECVKLVDADCHLIDMNPAGLRMIAAGSLDQVRGVSTLDLVAPEFRPSFRDGVAAVFRGESKLQVFEIIDLTGGRHWMEQHAVPLFDPEQPGRVTEMLAVTRDITARKQTEAALRTSEARLNEAQRIARVGSWELNIATSKLYWSNEIFRLFEVDPTRFNATYEAFLQCIHPDDRDAVNAAYTSSLADRKPYRITHRLRMPDGRIKHVEEQCETDFAPEGTPLRSRGTVQDVTERVIAEEAIRYSLLEKETLLREIHHRVKNNLQIVSSLLYFQTRKVRDTQALVVFGEIRERLRAMILVHEKLYHSRDLAEVDFADYIRSLVQQLAPSPAGASPSIHFKVETEPLALPIEQALPCGMIVAELLTNVIKYAFPGGRGGEALVQLTLADGRISLTVSDDGVGLPPVFDAESPGSFGWQLIRNLTTQLEGTTTIERMAGTRVTVSFPQVAAGTAGVKIPNVL